MVKTSYTRRKARLPGVRSASKDSLEFEIHSSSESAGARDHATNESSARPVGIGNKDETTQPDSSDSGESPVQGLQPGEEVIQPHDDVSPVQLHIYAIAAFLSS